MEADKLSSIAWVCRANGLVNRPVNWGLQPFFLRGCGLFFMFFFFISVDS